MQHIFKAFLDLIFLRKGPEDLPRSMLLLCLTVAMIIVSQLLLHALVGTAYDANLLLEFATELVKIGSYVAVLVMTGFVDRIEQTVTAIMGCTAMMVLLFTAIFVFCRPLVGQETAGAIAWFVTPWLILVEGHIISRSIQRHWYAGIAIAVVVFALQLGFYIALSTDPQGVVG